MLKNQTCCEGIFYLAKTLALIMHGFWLDFTGDISSIPFNPCVK